MIKQIDYERIEKSVKVRKIVSKTLIYFLLSLWGLIVLFPFYWMILTSFKSLGAYSAESVPKFITLSPVLDNYRLAFSAVPL